MKGARVLCANKGAQERFRRLRVSQGRKRSAKVHSVNSNAGFDALLAGGVVHRSRFAV